MVEKKFLAYILYITLLEIRESAYADNNSRLYHLADMLHNIPFSLLDDEQAKEEYKKVLQTVEELKIFDWLNNRVKEFKQRFPDLED
ncbi:hypothetical protein [Parafilimonas sp.]|uniref:hypothetical protein n=1 Tax=Parafilimonas sp. TaxID=1969739 RepID=UPI0039E499B2